MRFIDIDRFDGGLVDSTIDIGDESINMIRYGQNIRTRGGAVKDRDGITEYCDFHLAVGIMGKNIGPLYEYKREASGDIYHAIVFSVGTKYYYVEADDPNVAVLIATLTSGDFYAINYYDHLFIANGDKLKIWNGNNLYDVGIEGPPEPFDFDDCAGATPASYRKYKYTYYCDNESYIIESEPSEEIEVIVLTAEAIQPEAYLYFIPSTDLRVNHIRLYATETYTDPDAPASTFYLLIELNADVTEYHDLALFPLVDFTSNELYDITDRSVPPSKIDGIFEIDNRVYAWGPDDPSILYYSEIGKPWYWPINNWDEVNRDDGDKITQVGAIGNVKFIFKQHSIYQWSGDPSMVTPILPVERQDSSNNMVRLGIGCKYPRTLVGWSNSLIFMGGDDQIYMLTINELIHLSEYVQTQIKDLVGIGTPKCAIIDDYLIVSSASRVMVCDLRRGKTGWEGYDVYDGSIYPSGWLVDHNGYCLGSYGDKIYRYYNSGVKTDVGIEPIKIFQPFYFKASNNISDAILRRVLANTQNRDNDFAMSVYVDSLLFAVVGLADELYSATDRWFSLPNLSGLRGHYLSARFQWTESDVIINSVSYGYLTGARH